MHMFVNIYTTNGLKSVSITRLLAPSSCQMYFKTRNGAYETLCPQPFVCQEGFINFNAQIYKGKLLQFFF